MTKIALLVDQNNRLSTFFESTSVDIYLLQETVWNKIDRILLGESQVSSVGAIRQAITYLVEKLGDCKVIAGKEISGMPYKVFDASGLSIFQMDEMPDQALQIIQNILNDDSDDSEEQDEVESSFMPDPSGEEGAYFIDLAAAQQKDAEKSSKQILLPFLNDTTFFKLTVRCSHLPPWFERELPKMNLVYTQAGIANGKIDVVIQHAVCSPS